MSKKWDIEDKTLNRKCLEEVIARVQDINDPDQVGVIAAQDIIDIVMDNLAPVIYNKGINDSKKLTLAKLSDLEAEIDLLRQYHE